MENKKYEISITIEKGAKQLINVVISIILSILLMIIFKQIVDKDFNIKNFESVIKTLSNSVVLLIPVMSAIIDMILNFRKHYKQDE